MVKLLIEGFFRARMCLTSFFDLACVSNTGRQRATPTRGVADVIVVLAPVRAQTHWRVWAERASAACGVACDIIGPSTAAANGALRSSSDALPPPPPSSPDASLPQSSPVSPAAAVAASAASPGTPEHRLEHVTWLIGEASVPMWKVLNRQSGLAFPVVIADDAASSTPLPSPNLPDNEKVPLRRYPPSSLANPCTLPSFVARAPLLSSPLPRRRIARAHDNEILLSHVLLFSHVRLGGWAGGAKDLSDDFFKPCIGHTIIVSATLAAMAAASASGRATTALDEVSMRGRRIGWRLTERTPCERSNQRFH